MGRFEEFLDYRRSPKTRTTYEFMIRRISEDPDSLLSRAEKEPKQVERFLMEHFKGQKTSGMYALTKLTALRSFFQFYDVPLSWRKIASVLPTPQRVAQDRAPTRGEISRTLGYCDLRAKVMVLCSVSGGFRVGAWNSLNVEDVEFLEGGICRLRIYTGEPEQYYAYISSEATEALQEYLDNRRRAGEEVAKKSPLLRDKWDSAHPWQKLDPRIVKRCSANAVALTIMRALWKSGIRTEKKRKHEFKMVHGFRKYFKSNAPMCPQHGPLDAEVLMGHRMAYYRPTPEHLLEYYRTAVPHLSIDEKYRLKEELQSKEKEHKEGFKELKLDYLTLKDQFAEGQKRTERMEAWMNLWAKDPDAARKVLSHSRKPDSPQKPS